MTSDDPYAHLDRETDLLQTYWRESLDWVRAQVDGERCERIADLGAGNGVGAVGLARRFDAAAVIAVDSSEKLLDAVRSRALGEGVAARVRTVRADLEAGWPDELAELDLVWASMSLHHGADPERVLRDALAATRPGGVLAVAELTPQPTGPSAGPGHAEHAAAHHHHHHPMPTRGTAWAPRLRAAGWDVVAEREFVIDVGPDADAAGHLGNRTVTVARRPD